MKKLLYILILLPALAFPQEFVQACRADANVELPDVSMPLNMWTNALILYTPKMPTSNYGASNVMYHGWSKQRFDGVQPVAASQPPRVITNGLYALNFDAAADDFITIPYTNTAGVSLYADSNQVWSVAFRTLSANNVAHRVVGKHLASATPDRAFGCQMLRGTVSSYTPAFYINGTAIATSLGHDDGTWHHYVVTWDKTTAKLYHGGVYNRALTVGTNANTAINEPLKIGDVGGAKGTGNVTDVGVWDRVLTPAECAYLNANSWSNP